MQVQIRSDVRDSLYNSRRYLFLFGSWLGFLFVNMAILSCSGSYKNEVQYENVNLMTSDSQESDAQFLVRAVDINMMEMQLGQLAQKKASSTEVMNLGKKMEEGYIESNHQLIDLAKNKLVTLPTITTKKAQAAYDNLNEKSEIYFDKAYCRMMVSEHRDAIALFEKASANAKDPEIKAWAMATLPVLKSHLEHALMCQKKVEAL